MRRRPSRAFEDSGPGGLGLRLQLSVDVDLIDLLVVEAEKVLDLGTLRNGRGIAPHDVPGYRVADPHRPIRGLTFIWTARRRIGRLQQIETRIQLGDVVPGGKIGFK